MPLIHSPSAAAFRANLSDMVRNHHPLAQSLAAAYRTQRASPGNGGIVGYDDGGMVGGIGGITPTAANMQPSIQAAIQQYSALPPEKLQELAVRTQGTPQGQIIQRVLAQKRLQPQSGIAATPSQPAAPLSPPQQQHAGGATRRDYGGGISLSEGMPSWTRTEASEIDRPESGFLSGDTLGRADAVKTTSPAGSYIIPADVISGLGEGNSLAGAKIMQEILRSGPYGTPLPPQRGGRGLPRPEARVPEAKGGKVKGNAGHVPVLLSHGEYSVSPADVVRIGHGSLKRGHKILDAWVEHQRKKHIAKLRSLPGPVKS